MVSRQLAQQIVNTVQDICGYDINFINQKGIIFASTDVKRIGTFHEVGKKAADTGMIIDVTEDGGFEGTAKGVNIPVTHNGALIAVIGITGQPHKVRKYAYLAEKITRLLIREQEVNAAARTAIEKNAYIINALLGSDMENPEYVFSLLSQLGISTKTNKRVVLIQVSSKKDRADVSFAEPRIYRLFQQMGILLYCFQFPNEFVGIAEEELFLENKERLREFACTYGGILSIGAGYSKDVFQLNASLRTARIALNSLSDSHAPFAVFDDLTLEIMLSSIETESREVFISKTLALLSPEDIVLLDTYFEQGQSLKGTCEKLFLHKNTLQYRLDRIHKSCGLNPRSFKDAVLLYLAVRLYYHIPDSLSK